jgi:transaldolase
MDPRDPQKAFEVMYRLGQEGVRVNATLGISMGQLVGAAEALRLSKTDKDNYISLFWGRREEARMQLVEAEIEKAKEESGKKWTEEKREFIARTVAEKIPDAAATLLMTLKYLKSHSLSSKVIVGSIRDVPQIEQAFSLGADIVTIPPKLLEEWMYTKRGEETADQFNEAYRKAKDKIKLI